MLAPRTIIRHSIAAELLNTGIQGDAVFVTRTAQFGDGDPYPNLAIYTVRESSRDRKSTQQGEQEITLTIECRVRREADRPADASSINGMPSYDGCAHPADDQLDAICYGVEATVVAWALRKKVTADGSTLRIIGINSIATEIDIMGQSERPYLLAIMSFDIGYEPCYEPEAADYCGLKEVMGEIAVSTPCIQNLSTVKARYRAR